MAKHKKGTKENPIVLNDLKNAAKRLSDAFADNSTIDIRDAQIKDDFCNYSYEIITGKPIGFTHKVTGRGIIDDDMRNAFRWLNVHLAVIDDVFKHSNIDIDDVDTMHTHELAMLYTVTGFKIKGGDENETIILIGNKFLSAGSRMELESPKIAIDSLSSYKWYNELKASADKCQEEVVLYHEGKYTVVEKEIEEVPDKLQVKMEFGEGDANDTSDLDEVFDFSTAKV